MDLNQEIDSIRKNLGDKDWISPKTEIRKSKIGGEGLFAIKPIKKDDLIVVWGGEYVDREKAKAEKINGKLIMQWDENLYSVEDRGDGKGYFVNHSCDPNLWIYGTYALIAIHDVKLGEELTADYVIWEADENYVSKWKCNCGSKDCRDRLTGKDWKIVKLQQKYKDHFSPLINKRIADNKF